MTNIYIMKKVSYRSDNILIIYLVFLRYMTIRICVRLVCARVFVSWCMYFD